jgi:hypothetical protein
MGEIEQIMNEYNCSREQAERILKQREEVEGKKIKIGIDVEGIEGLTKRLHEAESDARGFKQIAKKLATRLTEEGLPTDSSEINADNYLDFVAQLSEQKEFNRIRSSAEDKAAEEAAEPVGTGAGGQIPLAQATGRSGRREFSSHEEMVDWLHKQERSKNEETRKQAQAILDELMQKSIKGIRTGKLSQEFEAPSEPILTSTEKEVSKRRKDFLEEFKESLPEKKKRDE